MNAPARLAATCLAAGLLVTAPARADDPCAADHDRYCKGKAPVEVLSCLQSHRADLAPACRDHVELALVSIQAAITDCEADAYAFCRNVGRGEPTTTCLSRNQGKLGWRCQQDFDAFARREASSAAACAADASRACAGVKPGKGDVFLCLVFHGSHISPECRAALLR